MTPIYRILLLLLPPLVNAEQITSPDIQPGDIADPAIVNQLKNESNAQDLRIKALETFLSSVGQTFCQTGYTFVEIDASGNLICDPSPSDAFFDNVVLLLNGEETNGAVDNSKLNHSVTLVDNAFIDNSSKFGNGAYRFDGDLDYISLPNASTLDLGVNDWTIELWLRTDGNLDAYNIVLSSPTTPGGVTLATHSVTSGRENRLSVSAAGIDGLSEVNVNDQQWHFITICRSADNLIMWSDGIQALLKPWTEPTVGTTLSGGRIGRFIDSDNYNNFHGWVDEFRATKGVCRYSGNFTPPTEAFRTN